MDWIKIHILVDIAPGIGQPAGIELIQGFRQPAVIQFKLKFRFIRCDSGREDILAAISKMQLLPLWPGCLVSGIYPKKS